MKISIFIIIFVTFSNIVWCKDIIYSSKYIIENAEQLNGKLVEYKGEAIGNILYRNNKKNAWLNVKDETNTIGIWMNNNQLNEIELLGKYNVKGDTILITGLLNSKCKEHGGDLDIHAIDVEKVEKGYIYQEEINMDVFMLFRVISIPTVILLITVFFLEKNKKNISNK